jgi:hypothetical protein
MFKSWLGLIFVGSRWARALYFVLGFLRAWKTLIDKLGLSHSRGQALLNNKKVELNPKPDRPLLKCCAAHNRERESYSCLSVPLFGRRGVYEDILWLSFAQKNILRTLWMLSQTVSCLKPMEYNLCRQLIRETRLEEFFCILGIFKIVLNCILPKFLAKNAYLWNCGMYINMH